MTRAGVLPPGVEAGGLGKRFVSYVIDGLVPAILGGVVGGVLYAGSITDQTVVLVVSIAVGIVALGWAVLCWWMLATKGATPGMKLMKLQFVSMSNGRPVGWGRALLRQVVLGVLAGTSIGAIVVLITIVVNVRGQGLHDVAGSGVVIRERKRTAGTSAATGGQATGAPVTRAPGGAAPVGLPAHLQPDARFAPGGQDWSNSGFAPPASAAAAGEPGSPAASHPAAQPGSQPVTQSPFQGGAAPQPAGGQPMVSGAAWQQQAPTPKPWQQPGGHQPHQPAAQQPSGPYPPVATGQPMPQQVPGQPVPPGSPQAGSQPTAPLQAVPQFPPAGAEPPTGATGFPTGATGFPTGATGFPTGAAAAPDDGVPDDGTRLVPRAGVRAPDQGWLVALDGGRTVPVTGLVLIGRNPVARAGDENAELVAIGEGARTVSKTHLAVGVDHRGIWVSDRGSTNGSAIAHANGEYEPCPPGEVVRVREGQVITFGEHRLEIQRSHA